LLDLVWFPISHNFIVTTTDRPLRLMCLSLQLTLTAPASSYTLAWRWWVIIGAHEHHFCIFRWCKSFKL